MKRGINNDFLEKEKLKFEKKFLQETDLSSFAAKEQIWVRNNLNFIYSKSVTGINLMINPYCQFVKTKGSEENIEEDYIMLPKHLSMDKLYIHIGLINKADRMIFLIADYKEKFTLPELFDTLLCNIECSKKEMFKKRLDTLIRKFLSYQYLVII